MNSPYRLPSADAAEFPAEATNNSGGGSSIQLPPGIKGWSWGAFFWSWIWSPFNRVWIGLLALVPYVGLLVAIYLGSRVENSLGGTSAGTALSTSIGCNEAGPSGLSSSSSSSSSAYL